MNRITGDIGCLKMVNKVSLVKSKAKQYSKSTKSLDLCVLLLVMILTIENCSYLAQSSPACLDSPIRKPPRFGKRFGFNSGMMYRMKQAHPCIHRLHQRSDSSIAFVYNLLAKQVARPSLSPILPHKTIKFTNKEESHYPGQTFRSEVQPNDANKNSDPEYLV